MTKLNRHPVGIEIPLGKLSTCICFLISPPEHLRSPAGNPAGQNTSCSLQAGRCGPQGPGRVIFPRLSRPSRGYTWSLLEPRFLQIRLRHESRDKYVIHISKTAFQNDAFFLNATLLCEHYGAAEQVTWLMTHPYRVGAPPIGMLQLK